MSRLAGILNMQEGVVYTDKEGRFLYMVEGSDLKRLIPPSLWVPIGYEGLISLIEHPEVIIPLHPVLSKETKRILAGLLAVWPQLQWIYADRSGEVYLSEFKPRISTDGSETMSGMGVRFRLNKIRPVVELEDEIRFEMGPVYFGNFEV